MIKSVKKSVGLKAKPKKLVQQLALALGLGVIASNSWGQATVCARVDDVLTCSGGNYSVEDGVFRNAGNIGVKEINISVTGSYSLSGPKGIGLYVNGDETLVNAEKVHISTAGIGADGIRTAGSPSKMTLAGAVTLSVRGLSGDGINATVASATDLTLGNNANIMVRGGVGVRANLSNHGVGTGNNITLGDNAVIATTGGGRNTSSAAGYAVYAGNRDTETMVMPHAYSAKVTIGNNSIISTSGIGAYAIFANKTGKIQLGSTTVSTSGTNAHGIVALDGVQNASGSTTQLFTGGQVYLTGGTVVTVDTTKGSYAMYSKGAESFIGSKDLGGNITSGIFNVTGNLVAADQGVIDLNMTAGSLFTGATNAIDATNGNGTINLKMAGASSKWNVTGDSNVTELALADNAQVILGDSARHAGLDPAKRVILTVDKLSGNGKFYLTMNATRDGLITDYDQEMGDRLVVTGEATGRHKIIADDRNTGAVAVKGAEVLRLVNVQNGTGTSNAVFELENGAVDIGAYRFDLNKEAAAGTATNWVLKAKAGGPGGLPGLTNIAQHTAGILSTNYLLGHVETQTLLQRMGELRQGEANGDVWGRVYAGKLDSFENKRLSNYDMDYNGMQLGVDRRLDTSANGDVYIGAVVGYGKADVNYTVGSGQTDSYHVGAYGTYKSDNGFYVDGIIKYAHMKNEVNTLTGGGYAVNGSGNTNGFSIGVEVGKRFYTDGKQEGFYVEPQGQLTYGQQNGATITSSNGLRTDLDSYTSILGRASVILGYDISQGKNPINVYFKTGYVKEFDGETGYTFNRFNKEKYDFDGGWWDNGIGVNVQLAERHHIYGEASYARGGSFDKKQVNVGYRYSF